MVYDSKSEALLAEIRDLLMVIAEPQLAERDRKIREELKKIGGGEKKQAAILAMADGNDRKNVMTISGIDGSNLTKLVTELTSVAALEPHDTVLKLRCRIPQDFFKDSKNGKGKTK